MNIEGDRGLVLWHIGLNCPLQCQQVLVVPRLIQLPPNMLGNAAECGPSAWYPASTWKTRKKLLASALPSLNYCGRLRE